MSTTPTPLRKSPLDDLPHRRGVVSHRLIGHWVYALLDCGHEKHERDTPFSFTATEVHPGEKLTCFDCCMGIPTPAEVEAWRAAQASTEPHPLIARRPPWP